MHQKLKTILLNNWLLALIVAILLIVIIQPGKNQYLVNIEDKEIVESGDYINFCDLDNDGISERIVLRHNQKGNACIKGYNPAHLGQFNTNTSLLPKENHILFEDIDHNGLQEVYFMGMRNDSVFVNQIDIYSQNSYYEYFVDTLPAKSDAILYLGEAVDLDKDGHNELLLNINGGYSRQPRKIYSIDIKKNLVKKTPLTGAKVFQQLITDLDNDGLTEIFSGTFASQNYGEKEVPYPDSYSWVFAFDNNLQFKFPPIKTSEKKSSTRICYFQQKKSNYILATINHKDSNSAYIDYCVIDLSGQIVLSDSIYLNRNHIKGNLIPIRNKSNELYFLSPKGIVLSISPELKLQKENIDHNFNAIRFVDSLDINNNGYKEVLFNEYYTNIYYILDDNVKCFTKFELPSSIPFSENISLNHTATRETHLVIQKENEVFYVSYKSNIYWKLRFIIWLAIYFVIFSIFRLVKYIQTIKIQEKIQVQQRIRELQFKTITSQLNPHFTFNILNNISNSIYDKEKPELYDQFVSFSKLIREILNDSEKITRELNQEISFTKIFLELQKYRFKDAFDFYIKIEKNVNSKIPVPKLIIQIFAENSIKHAFPFHQGEDKIEILVGQDKEYIIIKIIDNGKGFSKAKQSASTTNSTGRGINIIKEYIRILNTGNSRHIKIDILETNKEDKTGTTVTVKIPLRYTYSLDL